MKNFREQTVLKKVSTSFVALTLFVSVGYGFYAPERAKTAHAIPVTEVGAMLAAMTILTGYQSQAKPLLESLGWMLAKATLDSITASIVNWINSGFEGSPAFVSDLKRNLSNLSDAVAEDFIRGLDEVVINNTGISIRAPFQDQIARGLREEFYRTTSSYGFDARHRYSDCYGGRSFNLNSFFCESQNDANNAYGRYQIARNELFRQLDQSAQTRLQELGWGRGFLSWRGPCGRYGTQAAQGGNVNLSQRETNASCPIRTPGTVIESQLVSAVGSPIRQLEIADNIDEILGALMSQLVSQVLGGGGLSGASQASSGGGRTFIEQAAFNADPSGGFALRISDTRAEFTAAQAGWKRIADAARNAKSACVLKRDSAEEADTMYELATAREQEASEALVRLQGIDAERVRLVSAGNSDPTAMNNLVRAYGDLISSTSNVVLGIVQSKSSGGTFYTQMTQLAARCR